MRRRRGKPRKHRFRRFDFKKALFVLPNLFTVSSIFCGFYALIRCAGTPESTDINQATLAIFFGFFFDSADGRVARLTRTQTQFGVQLDSLADMVTFGVAPAFLIYQWSLFEQGTLGAFVAAAYVACAAMRLARFNVLAARGAQEPNNYFTGVPTPLSAAVIVSLVMLLNRKSDVVTLSPVTLMCITAALALLMVSNVRYRSFKKIRPEKKHLLFLSVALLVLLTLTLWGGATLSLVSAVSAFVIWGVLETLWKMLTKSQEAESSLPGDSPDS
jgi:CDP-diacylglycerol---serine O-phosphatidyltransferase